MAVPEELGLTLLQFAAGADPQRIIRAGKPRTCEIPLSDFSPIYHHVSDRHELAAVISGTVWLDLPGGPAMLGPGDLAFVERGVRHGELLPPSPAPYTILWCHFSGNQAMLTHTYYTPESGWRWREQVDLYGRTDVEGIAINIAAEFASQEPGWEVCARGLLQYLFWVVIRRLMRCPENEVHESPGLHVESRTWEVVREVLAYCELENQARVDLRHIAATIGYHPSYLSRLIARHLGRPLSKYLHERRMDRARSLLHNADLSVREIALSLGYDDPAHFSRAFSRAVGVSPRTYRQHRLNAEPRS